MKKTLSIVLSLCLSVFMTACGAGITSPSNVNSQMNNFFPLLNED